MQGRYHDDRGPGAVPRHTVRLSRVLFEIGPKGADLRDLRARLDLDSGYLSRLVQSLASKGLVRLRTGPDDERVRHARLTRTGLAER